MNSEATQDVSIDAIDVGPRLRSVDMDYANLLASSMADPNIGQLTAIEVRPKKNERYELVAGAHRLAAARINGWTHIRAAIRKSSDLEAELREIDENLVRRDLSPLDRATHLARRQEVYQQLHPDTTKGKAGAASRWHANDKLSFASDAATKMGVSERDIQRSIRRFTKIVPDIRESIALTWIATRGSELDALARLGPAEQRRVVKLMLQEAHPAKSVAAARRALAGGDDLVRDVDAEQLQRLAAAWTKAGAKARAEFVAFLVRQGAVRAKSAS